MNAHDHINEAIKEAALADWVGLDVFGVGEHQHLDFPASSRRLSLLRSLKPPNVYGSLLRCRS